MAVRRETLVEAVIDIARNDVLSDEERIEAVGRVLAEIHMEDVGGRQSSAGKRWLHHPLYDDVIVGGVARGKKPVLRVVDQSWNGGEA